MRKITLYRFNQGGLILLPVAQMRAGGAEPRPPRAPLTLTTADGEFDHTSQTHGAYVHVWMSAGKLAAFSHAA